MKPQIIKADTAGCIVNFNGDIYYVGDKSGEGIAYKDKAAFDNKQGICYTPEYDFYDEVGIDENVSDEMLSWMTRHNQWHVTCDNGFTYDDLRERVYHWENGTLNDIIEDDRLFELFIDYMVDRMFGELEWQTPDSWLNELDVLEQWENCPQLSCEDPRFPLDDKRLTDKQMEELYETRTTTDTK